MTEQDMHEKITNQVFKYMAVFFNEYAGKTEYNIGFPDVTFKPSDNIAQCQWWFKDNGYCEGEINFNSLNIEKNFDTYMNHIVGHEVVHWCVALLHGEDMNDDNESHKEVFTEIMEFFGMDCANELPAFHYHPIKGMYQWKCECSTLNMDEEENSEAHEWGVECENCKQDYVYHGVNK